jgi:hypothetical protein
VTSRREFTQGRYRELWKLGRGGACDGKENARKLTRVRDQTPTGGPAISKSANGDSIDRELKALSDQLAEVDLERSTQIQDENDIDCYGNLTEAAPVTTRKRLGTHVSTGTGINSRPCNAPNCTRGRSGNFRISEAASGCCWRPA